MTIHLDHTIVPSRNKAASAKQLAQLLGVPWGDAELGPFTAVRGPMDMQVDTQFGGRGIYWNEPDAHQWEMLTVSYARQPA
jgi:hypothetical protein